MKESNFGIKIATFIYAFAVIMCLALITIVIVGVNNFFEDKKDFDYSINAINDSSSLVSSTKVLNGEVKAVNPYNGENVSIGRGYYEKDEDETSQENSIIFFENTYIQNTGVDYISDNPFKVVSILPGKVISILTDENLGNILKIEHDNNLVSVYEGIDNISVKVGDSVLLGQEVATSSVSNINKNFTSSLHFELFKDNVNINPIKFFND